jgi:N-acetylmuramoyl-L-alanine amidase
MASKVLYVFDPGHGGMIDGKYQTNGKYSPKFDDGTVLYEGVNNRDNVRRAMASLSKIGLSCVDIVNSEHDVPLSERVKRANELAKTKKCMYISVHSDAAGDASNWNPASGISVYTSPGQTKSDMFAAILIDELQNQFGNTVKWRVDNTDGDEDKEENFYVLRETSCPAVLIEGGFHTNKQEAARMLTNEWKDKLSAAIAYACHKWEKIA